MNIICLKLVFVLSMIIVSIHARDDKSPDSVEFTITSIDEEINVRLKKNDPHLANENLPVYIVREHDPDNLEPFKQIVEAVGKFSMYQDPETSSAAVLFEKENKFRGVINVEYIINNLDYIPGENKLHPSVETVLPQLKPRFPVQQNKTFSRKKRENVINANNVQVKTCLKHRHSAYIEILVMVDSSMIHKNILSPSSSDDYTPVVSHVLTLFNSVDMLFKKVNVPQIKINVAGIIIGERPETFEFLEKCVETMERLSIKDNKSTVVRSLDAQCTANAVGSYIFQFRNNLEFRNSFDNVIFLTGLPIHQYKSSSDNEAIWLKGFQGNVDLYNKEEQNAMIVRVGATTGERYFGNYVAVAHELGHGFSIKGHDPMPYIDNNGNCCTFIMRQDNKFCKKCLAWSPKSQDTFRTYFNSPASCIYMNKPRSLHSGPYRTISARSQCNCYGFELAKTQLLCNSLGISLWNKCNKPLQCVDQNGAMNESNYPMDGTPCGFRKVCWGRKCQKV